MVVKFWCSERERFRLYEIKAWHHCLFGYGMCPFFVLILHLFCALFMNETTKGMFTASEVGHLMNSIVFICPSVKVFDPAVF